MNEDDYCEVDDIDLTTLINDCVKELKDKRSITNFIVNLLERTTEGYTPRQLKDVVLNAKSDVY